jgi:hypothetical protein
MSLTERFGHHLTACQVCRYNTPINPATLIHAERGVPNRSHFVLTHCEYHVANLSAFTWRQQFSGRRRIVLDIKFGRD